MLRKPSWQKFVHNRNSSAKKQSVTQVPYKRCCRHQHCAFNVSDTLEHVAVVLETAVKSMPSSVQQAQFSLIFGGFKSVDCDMWISDSRLKSRSEHAKLVALRRHFSSSLVKKTPISSMTFTKAILDLSIEDSFGKCKFLNCPFINSFISILADFLSARWMWWWTAIASN